MAPSAQGYRLQVYDLKTGFLTSVFIPQSLPLGRQAWGCLHNRSGQE